MLVRILTIISTVLDWALWLSILGFVLLVGYCLAFNKNIHWKIGKFELVVDATERQSDHQ